jgi:hypothetical protein
MKNVVLVLAVLIAIAGGVVFVKSQQQKSAPTTVINTEIGSAPIISVGEVAPEEVAEMNAILYGIRSKADVPGALQKIIEIGGRYPQSSAAHIYSMVAKSTTYFQGIAWRLRFLVEPVDVGYIGVISWLRAIKRNADRRAPHLDALFDYFVDPNPEVDLLGQKGQFTSLGQFQDWMAGQVAPRITTEIKRARELLDNLAEDEPVFLFDVGLVFGAEEALNMGSQTIRFRKFMPAHMRGMLANMQERMGFGYFLASYRMEELAKFLNTLTTRSLVAKKSDFQRGLISNVFDIHLQSPKEISALLKESTFEKFLTHRKEARTYLPLALESLRSAVNDRVLAYQMMERLAQLPNQNEYFISGDAVTSRTVFTLPVIQKRLRLIESNDPVVFNDRVTNAEFPLHMAALFNPDNKGMQDLKRLYPNEFVNVAEKEGNDPKTFKWNYQYGMATGWPDPTFAGVLPGTRSSEEYKKKLISLSRDASLPALTYWLRLFY